MTTTDKQRRAAFAAGRVLTMRRKLVHAVQAGDVHRVDAYADYIGGIIRTVARRGYLEETIAALSASEANAT